jgi:hypothetical protein
LNFHNKFLGIHHLKQMLKRYHQNNEQRRNSLCSVGIPDLGTLFGISSIVLQLLIIPTLHVLQYEPIFLQTN